MPEKKAPKRVTRRAPVKQDKNSSIGTAVRTLVPAIPLAIALVHGAMSPNPPTATAPPGQQISSSSGSSSTIGTSTTTAPDLSDCGTGTPCPLLGVGHPVSWWFVFKLNASAFPDCGTPDAGKGADTRTCPFGGTPQTVDLTPPPEGSGKPGPYRFGLRYAFASSEQPALADGGQECMGTSKGDPVGATFDEVYNGNFHYLLWNDQFHDTEPAPVQGCSGGDCGAPWGHSKGMVAWNDAGEGFVMQVSTPSWPGSGSPKFSRATIGNTLGCIHGDDDVEVSQHFFALRLSHKDLLAVLQGLYEASVVAEPNPAGTAATQFSNIGTTGPDDVAEAARKLGGRSQMKVDTIDPAMPLTLSSGVRLIAKPSGLHVPPWQMVSSLLGGVPLRAATWWADPQIYSTTGGDPVCWSPSLKQSPGAVEIAITGKWNGIGFNLIGNPSANHAKIGVSTSGTAHYAIFGDENQQGSLGNPGDKPCDSSQNGRGGLFFAMDNPALSASMTSLITGLDPTKTTAPTSAPPKK
jgi:hypothetical protein